MEAVLRNVVEWLREVWDGIFLLHLFTWQDVQEDRCLANLTYQYMLVLSILAKRFRGSLFAASYLNEKRNSYILRKEFVFRVVVLLVRHGSVAESATFRRWYHYDCTEKRAAARCYRSGRLGTWERSNIGLCPRGGRGKKSKFLLPQIWRNIYTARRWQAEEIESIKY